MKTGFTVMLYSVHLDCRLWLHVSEAILMSDQTAATQEKFILEDSQRKAARERKVKLEEWTPRNFERNNLTGEWMYIYSE